MNATDVHSKLTENGASFSLSPQYMVLEVETAGKEGCVGGMSRVKGERIQSSFQLPCLVALNVEDGVFDFWMVFVYW